MMEILRARQEDIPVIRQLAEVVWRPTYTPIVGAEQIEYMLDMIYSAEAMSRQMEEGQVFLLLRDEGTAKGFAAYSRIMEGVYKLNKIYVDTRQQGKGYGKALLDVVIEEVRGLGAK